MKEASYTLLIVIPGHNMGHKCQHFCQSPTADLLQLTLITVLGILCGKHLVTSLFCRHLGLPLFHSVWKTASVQLSVMVTVYFWMKLKLSQTCETHVHILHDRSISLDNVYVAGVLIISTMYVQYDQLIPSFQSGLLIHTASPWKEAKKAQPCVIRITSSNNKQ